MPSEYRFLLITPAILHFLKVVRLFPVPVALPCLLARGRAYSMVLRIPKGRFRRYDFAYDYRMRHAYATTTQIASCKSTYNILITGTQHEKCRRILKHVLKLYDNRSHIQCYMMRVVYNFGLTQAALATKKITI